MNDRQEEDQLIEQRETAQQLAEKALDVLKRRAPTDPEAAAILDRKGVTPEEK